MWSVALSLMAIRPGYGTALAKATGDALVHALVDHAIAPGFHGPEVVVLCEPAAHPTRLDLAVEAVSRAGDLWRSHPHAWSGGPLQAAWPAAPVEHA